MPRWVPLGDHFRWFSGQPSAGNPSGVLSSTFYLPRYIYAIRSSIIIIIIMIVPEFNTSCSDLSIYPRGFPRQKAMTALLGCSRPPNFTAACSMQRNKRSKMVTEFLILTSRARDRTRIFSENRGICRGISSTHGFKAFQIADSLPLVFSDAAAAITRDGGFFFWRIL